MLCADGLSKSYGAVRAISDVSATFADGEIHAVLGENGAGKSTLMAILAGFARPDSGQVSLNGIAIPLGQPFACRRLGIAMIHQHFTLVPQFTVGENLALARLDGLAKPLSVSRLAQPALEMARQLGWQIDPTAPTGSLPVGAQQRVEILKNLADNAHTVIFDEPTAVLSPDEIQDLFRVLRRLKHEGKAVILIAHKLAEVLAVADRVTILRHGKFIATAPIGDVNEEKLAQWMVGDLPSALTHGSADQYPSALYLRGLSVLGDRGEAAIRGLDLEVGRGEIAGIGGVDGNGQVELAEVLAGVRRLSGGVVNWDGKPLDETVHTGYIPQDRQSDGLALGMSIEDNLAIEGRTRTELTRGAFLRSGPLREWSKGLLSRFDIRAQSVSDLAGSLSGGNQQKVVVSRVMDLRPELLVAVNPTRGLDLQASAFVHQQILDAASAGTAVVLISTDLDELAGLADRTYFLSAGRLTEAAGASSMVGGQA